MTVQLAYSELLGRKIRVDEIDTLGISTLTCFDEAVRSGDSDTAEELLNYFWEEALRIGEALFQWMTDIIAFRLQQDHNLSDDKFGSWVLRGIRAFEPSDGDRNRAVEALREDRAEDAVFHAEIGRVRYAALHDAYVAWIQQMLTDIAADFGEEAIKDLVLQTYEHLWKPRYEVWWQMTPLERLQLSVEGMRGHLSGADRRGDVGVLEEEDRFTMILDPCGSCGILRRGDPDSGRDPAAPAGNRSPHPWSWFETDKSWYSLHSPIVMQWLDMNEGRPPFRPLQNCDRDEPCLWFIYKDPERCRSIHYTSMGFETPAPRHHQ